MGCVHLYKRDDEKLHGQFQIDGLAISVGWLVMNTRQQTLNEVTRRISLHCLDWPAVLRHCTAEPGWESCRRHVG